MMTKNLCFENTLISGNFVIVQKFLISKHLILKTDNCEFGDVKKFPFHNFGNYLLFILCTRG